MKVNRQLHRNLLESLRPWLAEGWEADLFHTGDIHVRNGKAAFLFRAHTDNFRAEKARLFAQTRVMGGLRRKPVRFGHLGVALPANPTSLAERQRAKAEYVKRAMDAQRKRVRQARRYR